MTFKIGEQVCGIVEKVVFNGKGLIRSSGWVIFVDGVIAGEEVLVSIQEKKKSYYIAELVSIIKPSADRRKPLCVHYGRCPGCQLQHMEYQAQIACKKEWVIEALAHKTGFRGACELGPTANEYGYRRKISLKFKKTKEKTVFGYVDKDNSSIFPIRECPIVRQGTPFLQSLREFLEALSEPVSGSVTAFALNDDTYFVRFRCETGKKEELFLKDPHPLWKSLTIEIGRESIKKGSDELEETINGLKTSLGPKTFIQNYPEMSGKLYENVVAHCSEETLELYAGIGIMSLLLSQKNIPATAVEINPHSKTLFESTKKKNNLVHGKFVVSSVEAFLKKNKQLPNTWIVNPPRTGLTEDVISAIKLQKPRNLFYISCMPSTLARDIGKVNVHAPLSSALGENRSIMSSQDLEDSPRLSSFDPASRTRPIFIQEPSSSELEHLLEKIPYQIKEIHIYDMFPQTTHVETVLFLTRN